MRAPPSEGYRTPRVITNTQTGAGRFFPKPPGSRAFSTRQCEYREIITTINGLELSPSLRAQVLFQRGNAYLELGKPADAREEFERALRSSPEFQLPRVGLAMLALKQNRFEEAVELVDRALGIDPTNGEAWHAKGAIATRGAICSKP